jgi:ATP-dependent DNA helicase RecG
MQRLLQGEVGSGKTVCALAAMLAVVDAAARPALLGPHGGAGAAAPPHDHRDARTARRARSAGRLRRRHPGGAADRVVDDGGRRQALLDAASGDAGIVVGTHALLEDRVDFYDLGLVVVDEQHRFGVEQRDALRAKADCPPHVLVMTATPIPRTVAMTVFGDLEVSTLTELPSGRSPIQTSVVPVGERPGWLDRVWERVREEVAKGHQAYVVCPRIGEAPGSEDMEEGAAGGAGSGGADGPEVRRPPVAVLDVLPMLVEGPLAGLRVDLLHGRLPPEAKDDVMRRFGAGEVDVLVATTVVEVGVDVANATVMVILDAERFGGLPAAPAARARRAGCRDRSVPPRQRGRGGDTVAGAPRRGRRDARRLRAVPAGPGAAARGRRARRVAVRPAQQPAAAVVLRDEALIEQAREEASRLVQADPELAAHPLLRAAVARVADDERAEYLEKG